jgi:molybdopterin converting factor small subunit
VKISINYMAQVKRAAGVGAEQVELDRPCSASELVARLARERPALRALLLDADERLQPSVLLFVGDEQVGTDAAALRDGDAVTVLAPMAGG